MTWLQRVGYALEDRAFHHHGCQNFKYFGHFVSSSMPSLAIWFSDMYIPDNSISSCGGVLLGTPLQASLSPHLLNVPVQIANKHGLQKKKSLPVRIKLCCLCGVSNGKENIQIQGA
jgi:hypothetical protein